MSEHNGLRDFGVATPDEIQRAHDILHAILCGDVVGLVELPETMRLLHATHDALCWVLGGKCGEKFREVLNCAVREMRDNGVAVWRNHPPA